MNRTRHLSTALILIAGCAGAWEATARAFSVETVRVGTNPAQSVVIPETNEIVVINGGSDDVSVIDGTTLKVSTVQAGSLPAAIAVNPATGYAYVANSWGNTVTAFYGYGEGKKRKTYTVGAGPMYVAVNPATNKVYVSNISEATISVIDEHAGTTVTVPVGSHPRSIAVNNVTNRIYVVNILGNSVSVLDGFTDTVLATIPVGLDPYLGCGQPGDEPDLRGEPELEFGDGHRRGHARYLRHSRGSPAIASHRKYRHQQSLCRWRTGGRCRDGD